MGRKIVFFELNEVPYRVVDDFCERRPDSALARLLPRSAQYETRCEDEGKLQPWVTWPSVHRGVNNIRHGLAHLGQSNQDFVRSFRSQKLRRGNACSIRNPGHP